MKLRWMLGCIVLPAVLIFPARGREMVERARVPEGGLQPQAVVGENGDLHLIYLKGEPSACDLYYTRREPGGSFSHPLRVNSEPGSAIALGTVRGPQISLGREGRVHVAWNGSTRSNGKNSDEAGFFYTRLTDGKFQPQRNLLKTSTRLDGGGSLASDSVGHVYAFWHGLPAGGATEETNRTVFLAKSSDDGESFLPETPLKIPARGACGCCGLKAVSFESGKVAVLYRSADGAGGRDVIYLVSSDFGKTFQETLIGPWQANTCPLSTMSLARNGPRILMAWETKGKILSASGPERNPGTGNASMVYRGSATQKHPTVIAGKGHELIVWAEGTRWGVGGDVVWVCRDEKSRVISEDRVSGLPAWSKPTAVAQSDGTFLVIY